MQRPCCQYRTARMAACMAALVLLGTAGVERAAAQGVWRSTPQGSPGGEYSLSLEDVSAEAALSELNGLTDVGVIYEPSMLDGLRVTCHVEDTPVEALIACILNDSGLTYRRLPSGAFAVVEMKDPPGDTSRVSTNGDPGRRISRLSGLVTDAADGQPLQGATVALYDLGGDDLSVDQLVSGDELSAGGDNLLRGTATNADGFYLLRGIEPGRYALTVSFVGYASRVDTISLGSGDAASATAAMTRSHESLSELLVQSDRRHGAARVTAGHQRIRPHEIGLVPSAGVSGDLAGYLTTLPGVVAGGDRGGRLFIRGGEPSQNLVLLDGMVVYRPFHMLGFYSVFPTDILSGVDLHTGGFPARYSGRLSAVVDVSARTGNDRRFEGMARASPFMSEIRVEGPIVPAHASFLLSARESTLNRGAEPLLNEDLPFRFGDLFAKIYGPLTPNSRLSVSALRTHDRGTVAGESTREGSQEVRWRNEAFGVRWMFVPSIVPVIMSINISRSRHHTELGPEEAPIRVSSISHTRVATHAAFEEGRISWEGGWEVLLADARNHLDGFFQLPEITGKPFTEFGFYASPSYDLGRGLRLVPSARLQWYQIKPDPFIEPRLRMTWDRGVHRVSAAVGLYNQEVVGITDRRDVANVFTVWSVVPRAEDGDDNPRAGKLGRAWHGVVGYRAAPLRWLDVSLEAFYKRMRNLYAAEWTTLPWINTRLQPAEGRSIGLETRVEVRREPFYAFATYGLSSTRFRTEYDALRAWFGTESLSFRPPHDRRHQLSALVSASLGGFDAAIRWTFGSGLPYSRPVGFDNYVLLEEAESVFDLPRSRTAVYERPFNDLLPTYHRLDASLERAFAIPGGQLTLHAGAINVYNRRNVFYLDVYTLRRVDQLPFVPSFGIEVAFE